jgi:hypothetical protein
MDDAVIWARCSGRLATYVAGYARELTRRGYVEWTVEDHLQLVTELGGGVAPLRRTDSVERVRRLC